MPHNTSASADRRAPCRVDLCAIDRSLVQVQQYFKALSTLLVERRDPLVDTVRANMLAGYALIDDYVARGVDLFALDNFGLLLEINATVLCGSDARQRAEYARHLAASERRFYADDEGGGAKRLLEWYAQHRDESTWKRAAGVYVRILSEPQLFIEGNHRSGSLIVSYLQLRDGYPPFVLSLDNAEAYFNPSSVIRRLPKRGVDALFKLPRLKKRYARFLEEQASAPRAARYLRGVEGGDGGSGGDADSAAASPLFAPLLPVGSAR